jgi:hypothetical protein
MTLSKRGILEFEIESSTSYSLENFFGRGYGREERQTTQ